MAEEIELADLDARSSGEQLNSIVIDCLGIRAFQPPEPCGCRRQILRLLLGGSLGNPAQGAPVDAVVAYQQGILAAGRHAVAAAACHLIHDSHRLETLRFRELILDPSESAGTRRQQACIVEISVREGADFEMASAGTDLGAQFLQSPVV